MAMICLPKQLTNKFLSGLKDGSINPDKLSDMSSEDRRSFFANIIGEDNAKNVNALFESKLLLQDQRVGMTAWIKQVAGLNPEVQRDLIAKVNNLDDVLSASEQKSFLADLAEKKLGTQLSVDEANKLIALSKEATDAKAKIADGGDRMDYGRKAVAVGNYVNELKDTNKPTFKENLKSQGILKTTLKTGSELAAETKSLKASIEFTALFKQGFGTLMSHPTVWADNAIGMFQNFVKTIGGQNVMDEVKADVNSRPNAINGNYAKMKLATGVIEEEFPSSAPSKIPVVGRAFKASSDAFTSFQYENRADLADLYIKLAEKNGVDLSDPKQLPAMGKLVNSLTGRGTFGPRLEGVATELNNVFFSPRLAKSSYDMLLGQPVFGDGMTGFTQKQAAINLVKMLVTMATVITTANAIKPGSAETNPLSSNFGTIKSGDTKFNISGGNAALVVLAARLATMKTKNSNTGAVTPLNGVGKNGKPVFGGQTVGSTLETYFSNKLSPAASVVNDLYITGTNYQGTKPTIGSEAQNLLTPLQITNYEELSKDPNSANKLLSILANVLGVTAQTSVPTIKKK